MKTFLTIILTACILQPIAAQRYSDLSDKQLRKEAQARNEMMNAGYSKERAKMFKKAEARYEKAKRKRERGIKPWNTNRTYTDPENGDVFNEVEFWQEHEKKTRGQRSEEPGFTGNIHFEVEGNNQWQNIDVYSSIKDGDYVNKTASASTNGFDLGLEAKVIGAVQDEQPHPDDPYGIYTKIKYLIETRNSSVIRKIFKTFRSRKKCEVWANEKYGGVHFIHCEPVEIVD